PVVAAFAAMFRAPGDPPRTPAERAFAAIFAGGIISFGWYTAIKAAFITLSLGRLVEERNLIYVTPLVLVASATWLERPRVRLVALAGAAAFALYLILRTPYEMNYHYYAAAPGLGILQSANRNLSWTPETARHVLLALLAFSAFFLLAPRLAD